MKENKIAFCIVNDVSTYANNEIKTTIQNIVNFTISNLYIKGYQVFLDTDEDRLLKSVLDYNYAVIMSPGTEYIDGVSFFNSLNELVKQDFFLAGHVLDRTIHDAYYELHHQCYVINLNYYKSLNCPTVGKLEYNIVHTQIEPIRSLDNWHDDYTPKKVSRGKQQRTYNNRCHGWNLLRLAFENNLPVLVFNENIRNNKKHYYPESKDDFYKNKEYIDYKLKYCKEDFVHTENTEYNPGINDIYEQVVIPASGTLYLDCINTGRVIFYDYNKRALDYWKEHCPRKEGIKYIFVHTDLLNELSLVNYLESDLKTLVNLSNIFCYEGTAAMYSLKHRLLAQNKLVDALTKKIKTVDINFTLKADAGHYN